MNSKLNILLKAALSYGLTNREQFVDKVGMFLQDKMGQDKEGAEKYGENIVDLLESLNNQMLLDQIFSNNDDSQRYAKLEKQIEQLTQTVSELSKKIDQLSK